MRPVHPRLELHAPHILLRRKVGGQAINFTVLMYTVAKGAQIRITTLP